MGKPVLSSKFLQMDWELWFLWSPGLQLSASSKDKLFSIWIISPWSSFPQLFPTLYWPKLETWHFSFDFYKDKLLTKSIYVQSWLCWRFGEEGRRRGGQPSQQRKNKELQLILRQVFPKFLVDFAMAAAVHQLTSRILANFFLSFFLFNWLMIAL